MIPEEFIHELLNRVDIVDVIDKSVPLKKAGANYMACCPFHNEKSPSFTVSPSKQFYHCFGCGAHGTAISFVMEHNGLGFIEAVNELASMAGMIVPKSAPDEAKPSVRVMPGMQEVLQQALNYYRMALKQSPRAIEYLKGRGLSGQVAARFQMGYAPDGWQNLQTVFSNYDAEVLETVGLVVKNEQGRKYDRFRDRVMFPIHDSKGQVIGFGGRVIKPEDTPKYYNSPETPLFQKGHELYGLFLARRAIREAGRVLVVEGYMDVVALAQYGIEYAVAALGTATTPHHITKLMRQTEEIVFSFDGDGAGQKAAWRAAMNALPVLKDHVRLKFLFLPIEHDPDSYVRAFGKERFEAEVAAAMPFSQYIIQQLTAENPLNAPEDKVQLMNDAEPILKQLQGAPRLSLLLQKKVAELASVSLDELKSSLGLRATPASNQQQTARAMQRAKPIAPALLKRLIQLILQKPSLAQQVPLANLQTGREEEAMLETVCNTAMQYENVTPAILLQSLQGVMSAGMYAELAAKMMETIKEEDIVLEFNGALKQLASTWEKTASNAAEILKIAQERGLQALSDEQKAILQASTWGHTRKDNAV